MKKPKTYEIDTFEKLFNIANKDNIDRLSIDFLLWMNYVVSFIDNIKTKYPEYKDMPSSKICSDFMFKWIDDGKNDMKGLKLRTRKQARLLTLN